MDMSDYAVEISLPDHKLGDRWLGIAAIGPVLINGAQPANALTRVRMHFRNNLREEFRLDSDSTTNPDAPIAIDDPDTWEASIAEVDDFVTRSGKWTWDMEFYEEGKTSPLTLYKGVLTVHLDASR